MTTRDLIKDAAGNEYYVLHRIGNVAVCVSKFAVDQVSPKDFGWPVLEDRIVLVRTDA